MSKCFYLTTRYPTDKPIGFGVLSVDQGGDAYLFNPDGSGPPLARMIRSRMEVAAAKGIRLSGMMEYGVDGNVRYSYQEWWLAYE